MHPSVNNDLQAPTTVEPELTVALSSAYHESAREKGKSHHTGEKSGSLPEDVVTFSDTNKPRTKSDPANKNSSLPVSKSEKQALLQPVRSRRGFSIYG